MQVVDFCPVRTVLQGYMSCGDIPKGMCPAETVLQEGQSGEDRNIEVSHASSVSEFMLSVCHGVTGNNAQVEL